MRVKRQRGGFDEGRDCVRQFELIEGVDLDAGAFINDGHSDFSEESESRQAKTCGTHHVKAAGFLKMRLAILPPLSRRRVVIDASGSASPAELPEKCEGLDGGEHDVIHSAAHPFDGFAEGCGVDERGSRLEKDHDLGGVADLLKRVKHC